MPFYHNFDFASQSPKYNLNNSLRYTFNFTQNVASNKVLHPSISNHFTTASSTLRGAIFHQGIWSFRPQGTSGLLNVFTVNFLEHQNMFYTSGVSLSASGALNMTCLWLVCCEIDVVQSWNIEICFGTNRIYCNTSEFRLLKWLLPWRTWQWH